MGNPQPSILRKEMKVQRLVKVTYGALALWRNDHEWVPSFL